MSAVSVVFWIVWNLFDFGTDISLAISLVSEEGDSALITMGSILIGVSVIGLCLGIIHVVINRDHDSDIDDHIICSFKMVKIWVEDIPSIFISVVLASDYGKDCDQTNWMGMDAYTQILLTSIASTIGLVWCIFMECCFKAIKDDFKELWQKICGCFGMMFMITLIVLLWYLLAANNFGCDDNYTYDGYANNDGNIFNNDASNAESNTGDSNTGDSTTGDSTTAGDTDPYYYNPYYTIP